MNSSTTTLATDASLGSRRLSLADFAPLLTLAAVTLVFTLLAEDFLSLGTVTLVLKRGAVLAIVATGLTFVLLCAEIDLSVGTVALMSACICGVLWEQPFAAGPKGLGAGSVLDVCIVVAIPLLIALLSGLLSGWLTVSTGLPSFIITLAMMNITLGLAKFLTLSQKYNVPPLLKGLGNSSLFEFGSLRIPQSAALAAVVMLVAHLVLQHTRFGRYVYMTGGNRQAARLAGVRTELIVVACLMICASCSACGGMVNAGRLEGVSLDQNTDLLLDAVACVVLGGTSLFGGEGGIGRTLIGVLTFTVLRVGLEDVNPGRLIRNSSLPKFLLEQSWVTQFEQLRPFLLGVVLLVALVIHGRLVRKHGD